MLPNLRLLWMKTEDTSVSKIINEFIDATFLVSDIIGRQIFLD